MSWLLQDIPTAICVCGVVFCRALVLCHALVLFVCCAGALRLSRLLCGAARSLRASVGSPRGVVRSLSLFLCPFPWASLVCPPSPSGLVTSGGCAGCGRPPVRPIRLVRVFRPSASWPFPRGPRALFCFGWAISWLLEFVGFPTSSCSASGSGRDKLAVLQCQVSVLHVSAVPQCQAFC